MYLLPKEYLEKYKNKDYSDELKNFIKSIYGNELAGGPNPNSSQYGFRSGDIILDEKTLYRHNQFGYRSSFWDGSHEILALGCSHTYGNGIPEEGRWTNILEELSNKKIANLSSSGQSINFLVSQAFAYFKMFGNPKYVICLFPDPLRVNLPTNRKILDSKYDNRNTINKVIYIDQTESVEDKPKYLKKPYCYEDILPTEFSLFISMQSIYSLEQYCNSNRIKLIWSCWDPMFQKFISNLSEISLDNFISDNSLIIDNVKFEAECHADYKTRFDYYFIHGRDEKGLGYNHPGVHKNIHIAEFFHKNLKLYDNMV